MAERRQLVIADAGIATGSLALDECAAEHDTMTYDEAIRQTWRHSNSSVSDRSLLLDLVRYATLAPSSHNTQCWKFAVHERSIDIVPDVSRRCPEVDPDDHHLFGSLGCAAENLIQAALANGLKGDASFDAASGHLTIALEPTKPVTSPLFEAITKRQSTRAEFDGKPLSNEELNLLEKSRYRTRRPVTASHRQEEDGGNHRVGG